MSPRPPSGTPPPAVAQIADECFDLAPLAAEICRRYQADHPDEQERYGAAGAEWCRHDNQWLLAWAAGDVLGVTDLDEQVGWLARVLDARGFPLDRLAHNLRLAAAVVRERHPARSGPALADALDRAATTVVTLDPA
jgi:hypothetical protein